MSELNNQSNSQINSQGNQAGNTSNIASTVATNDAGSATSSIKGLEIGSIASRLVYAYYLVIGLFFLAIALFTTYNVFIVWFKYYGLDEARMFRSALFLCYMFLNFAMAYGFLFCRKWLLPLLGSNALILGMMYVYENFSTGFETDRQFISFIIAAVIFLSVLVTKKKLTGVTWRKAIVCSFIFVMLLSLFITKSSLVY
jgi:hypothetical protein